MRTHSWMAISVIITTFFSCQKSLINSPALSPVKTTDITIGPQPPPTYIWWGNLGILPFSDSEPGDTPGGDLYPMGFTINGKGYVVGSVLFDSHGSAQTLKSMFEYDLTTGVWTEKAPIPALPPVEGSVFVIGDNAYIVNPDTRQVHRYNQPTNTWSYAASMPVQAERFNATAFAIRNKGYVGLGDGEDDNGKYVRLNDFWEYDPATNTWTQKRNFPGGKRIYSSGFSVGSYGYVCSGQARNVLGIDSWPNDLWQYDPGRDSWSQKTSMPGPGFFGVGLDGYVNGGIHYGFVMAGGPKGCLQYNPATDTWAQLPDMPGGSRHNFAAFMINRTIIIGGGDGGGSVGGHGRMDAHYLTWSR